MTLMKFKDFKEYMDEGSYFVLWTKNIVKTKTEDYKIKIIDDGDKKVPYVVIPDDTIIECNYSTGSKNRSEVDTNDKIRIINSPGNKEKLKNHLYMFDNEIYFITGIGYDSIRVEKDGKPDYYWYYTNRGKYLLNKLFEVITQL